MNLSSTKHALKPMGGSVGNSDPQPVKHADSIPSRAAVEPDKIKNPLLLLETLKKDLALSANNCPDPKREAEGHWITPISMRRSSHEALIPQSCGLCEGCARVHLELFFTGTDKELFPKGRVNDLTSIGYIHEEGLFALAHFETNKKMARLPSELRALQRLSHGYETDQDQVPVRSTVSGKLW